MTPNPDHLLTPDGQRVEIAASVKLLCTARHPTTGEVVVLPSVVPHYRFDAMEPLSMCAGACNDGAPSAYAPVVVDTSLVVVTKSW